MTEQEKARKAAELLTAWADGKTLQLKTGSVYIDFILNEIPDFKVKDINDWHIKPEPKKQWYRVALMQNESFFTVTTNSENAEHLLENSDHFGKWLTDRIEYELQND